MQEVLFWLATGFVIATAYASFFEWILHKYLMHRPFGKLTYPFERHALTHHRIFRADPSYHLMREEDKHTIPMAWWNGPVLIAVGLLPYIVAARFTGHWALLWGAFAACVGNYGIYEYMHWCMHLPRKGISSAPEFSFASTATISCIIVTSTRTSTPLADLCLGTLLLRSKLHFKQAEGPSVPNVQPKTARCKPQSMLAVH